MDQSFGYPLVYNEGIAITNHPAFITINGWYVYHQKWVVYGIAIPTLDHHKISRTSHEIGLVC